MTPQPHCEDNHLWHAWVGVGRFIVRASTEEAAIALARKEALDYNARIEDVQAQEAGAELLSPEGEPAILDVDYS